MRKNISDPYQNLDDLGWYGQECRIRYHLEQLSE